MFSLLPSAHSRLSSMRAVLSLAALVTFAFSAQAVTVFDADFNGSTPISAGTGLIDNADPTNLNAGTTTGSWVLSGSGGGNPGAVVGNGSGDNALVVDSDVSGDITDRITGLFDQSIDLAGGTGLNFEFDVYASRQGNDNREMRLALQDSSGTGGNAYVLVFDLATNKAFDWLNTSNTKANVSTATGINSGFTNPAVDSYLSWGSGLPIHVQIEVSGQTTESDTGGGSPTTGALLSIDWDNDGTFDATDGDVEMIQIGPRSGGIAAIDRFELFYGGSNFRGAYFDNFFAETATISLPEPGDVDGDGIVETATVGDLGDDLGPIIGNFFTDVTAQPGLTLRNQGDLTENGFVDFADFRQWKDNVPGGATLNLAELLAGTAVPEPTSGLLLAGVTAGLAAARRALRVLR